MKNIKKEIYSQCTSTVFRRDISELCENCPIRIEINNGIENQIKLQALENKKLLNAELFRDYINREIANALNAREKMFLQSEYQSSYLVNKMKIFLWNTERIKVLQEFLEKKESIEIHYVVVDSINRLIERFKFIDIKISNELFKVCQLLEIGQLENAIEDLVKIIEHILTGYYKDDLNFSSWLGNKPRTLHNMLLYSKETNKIDESELGFFTVIKNIRNKEDHTLDFKLEKLLRLSGLLIGIGAIEKVASIVYQD